MNTVELSAGMHTKLVAVCDKPFAIEYVDNSYGGMEPATYFFKIGSKYIIDIKAVFEPTNKDGFMPCEIDAIVFHNAQSLYLESLMLHLFSFSNFIEHHRVTLPHPYLLLNTDDEQLPESITDDGSIAISSPIPPDEQGDGIPKLECEKATVFKVDYDDLDEFLSEVYGIHFEIVAEEELNNYSSKRYYVKPKPMDQYWQERFNQRRYSTQTLLNVACHKELIEAGEYLINVSW